MSPNQDSRRLGIPLHSLPHPIRQILLVRRILNDRHGEGIKEPQRLAVPADSNTLDHFLVRDSECISIFAQEEGEEDGVLRVSVDTGAGIAEGECVPEQGGASGFFQALYMSAIGTGNRRGIEEEDRPFWRVYG